MFLYALQLVKKIIELGGVVDWIMWENAPYFISSKQDEIITDRLNCKTILQHITDELGKDGFHVHAKILDASFYGTAQARKRGIILCRRGQVWDFPAPDDKQLTCFDVIGDRKVYTMLDSSRMRDPDNEFHRIPYVSPVQEDFIRLIPSGEAAIKFFEKWGGRAQWLSIRMEHQVRRSIKTVLLQGTLGISPTILSFKAVVLYAVIGLCTRGSDWQRCARAEHL